MFNALIKIFYVSKSIPSDMGSKQWSVFINNIAKNEITYRLIHPLPCMLTYYTPDQPHLHQIYWLIMVTVL